MSYIGVDLRTNSFTTCRLDADGSENFEACQLSEADVERLCPILDAGDELALEATANFVWFCGAIRPCVGRIVAVSPGQFQVILQSVKRTGRNNAQALAFFLSKGMLPETHLKFMAEAEPASLAQTRDSFVKTRTLLLNRIHALYNRRRMRLKKEGLASRKKLIELDTLREQTLNLTTALTKLDSAIEAATEKKGWLRRADQHRKVSECAQLQSCSQVLAIWITWPVLTNSQPVCIP